MAGYGKAQELRIANMRARKAFKSGNVSAVVGASNGTGEMPEGTANAYKLYAAAGTIAYTVMSYRTPIAFVLVSGEVIIPEVKYSVSTSGQQSEARRALLSTY